MASSSAPEELQYFYQDSEVHRGIPRTKPGSILPVAGREASVMKIFIFPEIVYKPPRQELQEQLQDLQDHLQDLQDNLLDLY